MKKGVLKVNKPNCKIQVVIFFVIPKVFFIILNFLGRCTVFVACIAVPFKYHTVFRKFKDLLVTLLKMKHYNNTFEVRIKSVKSCSVKVTLRPVLILSVNTAAFQ